MEIGAGLGQLTDLILDRGATVAAIEIDGELCAYLRHRLAGRAAEVVCVDVLEAPPEVLLGRAGLQPPWAAMGNLPYYITGLLLRRFLEAEYGPDWMLFMLQREVAESISGGPPRMSLAGVSAQFYADVELLFSVPAEAFYPPPKVQSGVVLLKKRREPAVPVDSVESFFKLVHATFSAPRKQLHNALSRGLAMDTESAKKILVRAGVDPTRRAQTLSLDEWGELYGSWRAFRLGPGV